MLRVGKIIGIGWNYRAHAEELAHTLPSKKIAETTTMKKEPLWFLKPSSSIIREGEKILLPKGCRVEHEVELGLVIGKKGKNISKEDALKHVSHYVLGLDMTARDMQLTAQKLGNPWSKCKGFDSFAPLGPLLNKSLIPDPQNLQLSLSVDGVVKQTGSTSDMIYSCQDIISYLSTCMTLEIGDLILTGTPAGVSPVVHGSKIYSKLSGGGKIISEMTFEAVDES